MASYPPSFRIPDLLSTCPLEDTTNPYYSEAAAGSRAWINSYNIFTDSKRAFFIQGQNELLCSHVYSFAGREQLRTTCDFVNLLFVVDEISDEQNGRDARATGQVFVKAMKNPGWDDGSVLAKITGEFRARFLRLAGPKNVRRFADLCETYTQCVGQEAELRERGHVLKLAEYLPLRRQNSAVLLCFALVEYILGIDLEDQDYEDEDFMDAYTAACDYVCWSNASHFNNLLSYQLMRFGQDVYSYDMEQSRGIAGNNIVTVLMNERDISLQEASDVVGDHCRTLLRQYLLSREKVAATHGREANATRFIYSIGQWMIGNLAWSFETVRYFGSRHLEVKDTGVVHLRRRKPLLAEDWESDCSDES